MHESVFPNFPFSQFDCRDQKLNEIAKRHGGWLRILDPNQSLVQDFLEELARAGYKSEEVAAMRAITDCSQRNQLLMQAANLRTKLRLDSSDILLEQQWSEILPKLFEIGISEREIDFAAFNLIPIISKWMSH